MIKQSFVFDDLLEKKFKILRASIMLGNVSNGDDVFKEYEESAREIDRIRNDIYEEKLASKMYTTVTLEEELIRLKDLILCIQNRIDERNAFLDDYIKITSNYLDNLDVVSGEASIEDYKLRLSNIDEYLHNCKEINEVNNKLMVLKHDLSEKYETRSNNDTINSKLEDELIEEFNKIISKDEYYTNLNYSEIDAEISKLETSVSEKETVLNTFLSSYDALVNAGISGAEREEYSSYVRDAGYDYYSDVEKKFVLNLYKIVLDKVTDYEELYSKRENINNVLFERASLRKKLDINTKDDLEYFIKLCDEQFNIIKSQRFNLEEIDRLIAEINELENKLSELEIANNRQEILDILAEFSINKPEESTEKVEDDIITDLSDEVFTDTGNGISSENIIPMSANEIYVGSGPVKSNMVIKIKEPVKINVNKAVDTAKLVMKKVVIVLEPKKFNSKRNKLEEVEKQLQEENEKIVTSNETLGIELDTKGVNSEENVKEIDDLSGLKINTDENNNVKLPTEIFIDEPFEETPDIFTSTDPFMDDNNIDKKDKNDMSSRIPSITNIGTVKPNSAFSKIEEAVKENDGVVLPTMGLSGQETANVPIVSENYIN